jgi:hypothetical protein
MKNILALLKCHFIGKKREREAGFSSFPFEPSPGGVGEGNNLRFCIILYLVGSHITSFF